MSQHTLDLSNISSEIGEAIEIFNFFERGNPSVQRVKELSKKNSHDLSSARQRFDKIIDEARPN
jgi:hypothetical protein